MGRGLDGWRTGTRTNHMIRCWLVTASSFWWWWAGPRWPSSAWASSSVSALFMFNSTALHVHSLSEALAQYSDFNVKKKKPTEKLLRCPVSLLCVCVHTCISSRGFPIQETPFISKQSRILCRLPINIQHQQWASGCSETLGDSVATHSHLLWKA